MKSVLLIRLGGLGDLLVAYPSIALIRKTLSPKLILACRAEYGALLKEAGIVDEVLDAGSAAVSGLFGGSGALMVGDRQASPALAAYDLIVGLMQTKEARASIEPSLPKFPCSKALFLDAESCSGSLSRFFFDKTAEFLASEGFVSLPSFEKCAFISVPSSWLEESKKTFRMSGAKSAAPPSNKFAVVHPGSGSASKRWPLLKFADVISRLASAGVPGFLVTGEAEEDMLSAVRSLALPACWRWVHQPPLRALAGMIASSSLYLGNDSGVTHLAAVCGASGAAVFRRENELEWATYGSIKVVGDVDIKNISAASVWKNCCRLLAID